MTAPDYFPGNVDAGTGRGWKTFGVFRVTVRRDAMK